MEEYFLRSVARGATLSFFTQKYRNIGSVLRCVLGLLYFSVAYKRRIPCTTSASFRNVTCDEIGAICVILWLISPEF